MLAKSLGRQAKLIQFPNRESETGKQIDKYLKGEITMDDRDIHQLFSDNRHELKDEIITLLNKGINVICDRYAYSGVAYTAAKGNPDLDIDQCMVYDIGLPAADVVFYLHAPVNTLKTREDFSKEVYEVESFQRKVVEKFNEIKQKHWKIIDATKPKEEMHHHILYKVQRVIKKVKYADIKYLWSDEL
jgi:dTMP kinase